MSLKDTINNLELMSDAFGKTANKPENYNTDWAYYLEHMSWSLHKHANELRNIVSYFNEI